MDGAELYLLVRGEDRARPVLLLLHGGPGGAERPLFRYFNGHLERSFVVAYLDQRGAGRSYERDADTGRLTVAQHLSDLDRVVDRLRALQGREQVVLLGHSWGAALALLYARQHPQKVSAVVAVAPLINGEASDHGKHRFALEEARRRNDAAVVAKLVRAGPNGVDPNELDRLVDRYGGYFHQRPSFARVMAGGVARGLVGPLEIKRIIDGNLATLRAMRPQLRTLDVAAAAPELKVPVVFMFGRHDRQIDLASAQAYAAKLVAPDKRVIWFERSAHNVPFEEPGAFNAAVERALAELGER